MASVNKVILIGNLGKDPEVRHLEGGVAVARFPLATSESYKDKNGQRVEKTEWHNIVLWRGLAEVAEKFLKKGQSVFIEGKIRTSQYQDKEGNQRYSTEIVADNMTMLTRGEGGQAEGGSNYGGSTSTAGTYSGGAAPAAAGVAQNDEPDDLPF
ncbi:single-stranded DNA-binding protein [Pontibacter sp. Tf4]|uniref:single-stranded DNA-binding protein n=1 Tax=Pontibacter sp. Tf4 TaxID=2761620 RepID=UPI0016292A24|nr:single-stranded DNA-binding protein [Pontibacter sp. Tf4]MBB6612950.1 single-stranded DNA-binding protein [Pontibacter sp. Tf4]